MNIAKFLQDRNVPFEVIEHPDTHDAQHLAQSIHASGYEVAKTVLLRADHGFRHVVAVLAATSVVDLKRASKVLGGSHLELGTEAEIAARCPDCEFGVLPPFGSLYDMGTMVDEGLAAREFIYFEGNSHHEAIRMKFEDFRQLESPVIGAFAAQRGATMIS